MSSAKASPATLTQGAHHIGLTVPDLNATAAFFLEVLGYKTVGEIPEYPAIFVSDGSTMITLWQAADPEKTKAFDRKNVIGLHHLAILVGNLATLDIVYDRLLAAPGVAIEFAPEPLGAGNSHHLMCSIPGGIRLELIAPSQ